MLLVACELLIVGDCLLFAVYVLCYCVRWLLLLSVLLDRYVLGVCWCMLVNAFRVDCWFVVVACCALIVVRCVPCVVCCMLDVVWYMLIVGCCLLFDVFCL